MKVGICMNRLEDMSKDELLKIMFELLRENPPEKAKVDENGFILLDKNNPIDREWYENDEDYDLV